VTFNEGYYLFNRFQPFALERFMKAFGTALVSVFLLGVFCSAQDASPAADTEPIQSLADAARANRHPKIDPQKEADIRRLLDLMGSRVAATQMMGDMEKSIKPLLTSSLPPGEYRDRLVQLFFEKFQSKLDPEVMVDLAIPVYDKYLSDADLKGMIEFYSTPLGKKMVQLLPQLMSECGERGRKWGEGVGRESMIEVLQEHPDLQQAMQASKKDTLPK
jgi:hypothetical protein